MICEDTGLANHTLILEYAVVRYTGLVQRQAYFFFLTSLRTKCTQLDGPTPRVAMRRTSWMSATVADRFYMQLDAFVAR